MRLRPRIAVVLLALGTIVGYGSGIAHVMHAHRHCHESCAGSHAGGVDPGETGR
jgi:hypothetical protein